MNIKKHITFFLVLLNILIGHSQNNGKINGKLLLTDIENKELVIKNTYIILKSKTKTDSVKVDENLSFTFDNLKADSLKIYTKPRSYPVNIFYKLYLKDGETKNVEIPYSSVCPYEKNKTKICPICKKKDKVIPIIYGLQSEPKRKKDKKKFKSGGCVVSDCQPNWFCERDKSEF